MIKLYDDKPIILREGIPINDSYQSTLNWNRYQEVQDKMPKEFNYLESEPEEINEEINELDEEKSSKSESIKEELKDFIEMEKRMGARPWTIYIVVPFYLMGIIYDRIFFYK